MKLNNLDILDSVILFFNVDVRIVFNYKLMNEVKYKYVCVCCCIFVYFYVVVGVML